MIFLGHCPDAVGLLARLCGYFAFEGINITDLEEHTEQGRFFLRCVGDHADDLPAVQNRFAPLGEELQMEYAFFPQQQKARVLLFCSQSLHCPLEVLARQQTGALNVEVVALVSDHGAADEIAEQYEIPFFHTPVADDCGHETRQLALVEQYQPDIIALGRYMRILSPEFLSAVPCPVINIHHSFLPSFVGGRPYEMAYERGVKMVGATAHFVSEELDAGPIIAQSTLPVNHSASVTEMKRSGAHIEKAVFAEALEKFSEHKILEYGGRTVVFG